jgi:hypothetical protein
MHQRWRDIQLPEAALDVAGDAGDRLEAVQSEKQHHQWLRRHTFSTGDPRFVRIPDDEGVSLGFYTYFDLETFDYALAWT